MITIKVSKNIISVQETEPLTSGSVSVYKCRFVFDASWDGFFRSAVFRVGSLVKTAPLDAEDMCDLPWELLEKQYIGLPVEVSVYGTKEETEILPTIWDKLGRVRSGSEPGEDVKAPTPNVYDQLTNIVRVYAEKVSANIETVVESVKEAEAAAEAAADTVAQIGTAVTDTQAAAKSAEEARLAAESAASTAADSAETALAASETATTASEQAAQSETNAAAHASSAQESAERAAEAEDVAVSAISSADEAIKAAETATEQAAVSSNAATIASAAASNAAQSESHAKQSADAAEAWSKKAEQAAGGGVLSFKGRGGAVTPEAGDYTAEMVGADASGAAAKALEDANAYTDDKIAAIPTPDVRGQIDDHNTDTTAHDDIREAIPNVPDWAMQTAKPTYTANEVGAAASTHSHNIDDVKNLQDALDGKAQSSHTHTLSNISGGSLPAGAVVRNSTDGTGLWYSATASGAFYATGANGLPKFGTLPVAQGGTGATTAAAARTALGAAASSHNQAASTVTAGTFAGQVVAKSSAQTYSTYLLRNTRLAASDTTPTVNGQICWTYE